ncbi:MAG: hypothetical protein C0404_07975 [Verrucomicrobia bacterium]|nr:hypothetical protein [Verrucomicrobiota bacterium]
MTGLWHMRDNNKKIASYRRKIRRLEEGLADASVKAVLSLNSRGNIVASSNMCIITVDDDMIARTRRNATGVFGYVPRDGQVKDVFRSQDAVAYFGGFVHLRRSLPVIAAKAQSGKWDLAYPTKEHTAQGFTAWQSMPSGSWITKPDSAEVSSKTTLAETYLVSPRELIPPAHDFRIEYRAISRNRQPCDLSVVTGAGAIEGVQDVAVFRPDQNGYCFALGAILNKFTLIQRRAEVVAKSAAFAIKRGYEHHVVAERIGGLLRIAVDGREISSGIDCLPLMDAGNGHVGLYTYGDRQVFRDLKVWTRPTCLDEKTLQLMTQLRSQILRIPGEKPAFVEPVYLRDDVFLLKNITEIVEQREQLRQQHLEAERMETLLHLASGAAHEINQPLSVLLSYLQIIQSHPTTHNTTPVLTDELNALKSAAERISEIVQKIGSIKQYKTKKYAGDTRILDINGSSSEPQ